MLTLDNFKKITLDDKTVFDNYYKKHPPVHSDEIFTTMISWMKYSNYHYALIDNNMIIMSQVNDKIRFRLSFENPNFDTIKQIFNLAIKEGSEKPLYILGNKKKEQISKIIPPLNFLEDRNYFDYVYLSSDLAELSGSSYAKIRNRLNKFKRNYEYSLEKITEDNMGEVHKFLKRWCLWKDCKSNVVLENEKKAILYSIKHFFDLGLNGLAILINENVEAISVYEKMNSDTAVVHYEKGSPDYDGIYKAINMETAKILQKDFEFINREEDMGIPGLRKAKMSYHPHHMVEVFHIDKKDIEKSGIII